MVSFKRLILLVGAGLITAMSHHTKNKTINQVCEMHPGTDLKHHLSKESKGSLIHTGKCSEVRPHHHKGRPDGYVTLINATPYDWNLTHLDEHKMDYEFPGLIPAGTVSEQRIIFKDNHVAGAAEAVYSLVNAPITASFSVQARHKGAKQISIQYRDELSSVNNPVGSKIDLGFENDGTVPFVLSGAGPKFTSSNPPTAWMQSSLSSIGSKSLREISMPASHDSGMYKITHHYSGVKHNTVTQSRGIYEQAVNGARYFDIRPAIRKGDFYVGHFSRVDRHLQKLVGSDVGGTGSTIQDIVSDVNRFNHDFPGELLILDVSHDMNIDHGFRHFTPFEWQALYGMLDEIVDLWVPEIDLPRDLSMVPLSTFITSGSTSATIIRLPYHAPTASGRRAHPKKEVVTERGGNGNGSGSGNGKRSGNEKGARKVITPRDAPSTHSSPIITRIAHPGAFVPDMWMPVVNRYSDTNKPDRMSADQISKMHEHQPAEDGALMGVWTLTQNWQHGVDIANHKHSILGEAVQAHRRLFSDLWPAMSKAKHPNLVQVDDIRSKEVLALTMAINDNFVGPSQFSRRGVPAVASEPPQMPCSAFDHVAHWLNLYPKTRCFRPHPFQSFARNAQELEGEWENDALANEHARVNDTAAMAKDEEAWRSRRLTSVTQTMTATTPEVSTSSLDVSTTTTPGSTVTDPPPTADDGLDESVAFIWA